MVMKANKIMMISRRKEKKEGGGGRQTYIPEDILVGILLKLPVKSITRFKVVQTSWFSLLSEREFCVKHLQHANRRPKKHGVLQITNTHTNHPNLSLRSLMLATQDADADADADAEVVEIENAFGEVNSMKFIGAEISGTCNGLVLVTLLSGVKESKDLILWNPSTRAHKRMHGRYTYFFPNLAGLGYDHSSNSYKGVIVSKDDSVEVYNFTTDSWEEKKYRFPLPYKISSRQPGTTLANGIPHWLLKVGDGDAVNNNKVILFFDVVEENIKEMSLPAPLINHSRYISILHGYLCLSVEHYDRKLYLWVMREYGVKESWLKLSISFPLRFMPSNVIPLEFATRDKVVMSSDRKSILIYDRKRTRCNLLLRSELLWGVATYIDSLAYVPQ